MNKDSGSFRLVMKNMTDFKYKDFNKLMSWEEVEKTKSGSCHDQVMYELHYIPGATARFCMELKKGSDKGGRTHSFVYYKTEGKIYWFEHAWSSQKGIHGPYNTLKELESDVGKKMLTESKYDYVEFSPFRGEVGMNLQQLVDACMGDEVNESYIINQEDILYNKDKFDSGEINLCFIVGHSGSGKSSMASEFNSSVEKVGLDDVVWNKMSFTMDDFKKQGNMIYSFFNGPGKKYYYNKDDVKEGRAKEIVNYEEALINEFIKYSMTYAKSHKDKKFIVEGLWIVDFTEPSMYKDYAFYIKGTSALVSHFRAIKRDSKDAPTKGKEIQARIKNVANIRMWASNLSFEKDLQKFVKYFSSLMKNDVVEESVATFLDDAINKAEKKAAEKKDYKDMMKLDGIRHPNKVADKVLKTSDKAVDKTMKALDKPAGAINDVTNKAIHKTVGGGISFYNKFTKKKIEAEKKRDIEAKAGVAVKGAAFMATKLIPMGPIDWTLNLIAVTKVPKSDDPIDKEIQKVATKAKDTLTDFRKEIKHYADEDRKYATAKQQVKDIERIEGKYEPVTRKLALQMDNIMKKKEDSESNIGQVRLRPAYESSIDISVYTDIFDDILLSSDGRLLESSYDLLYDFIYEDDNENYPIYEIINHYLSL